MRSSGPGTPSSSVFVLPLRPFSYGEPRAHRGGTDPLLKYYTMYTKFRSTSMLLNLVLQYAWYLQVYSPVVLEYSLW